MKILTRAVQFKKINGPVILAAGFFDGLHQGHQRVLASTIERAREIAGEAWVLTFDRHPLTMLCPSKAPPLLCTLEERLERLSGFGLDGVLVLPFTRRLANLEPGTFVKLLCGLPFASNKLAVKHIAAVKVIEIRCGKNWRFGRQATGTPELLAQYGLQYGFSVITLPFAEYQGLEISSTRIRYAVREGRLADAAAMLGRAYAIRDVVIHGRGVGKNLSAATANVHPRTEVLPPHGVYAVRAIVDGLFYNGVANLGTNPTFQTSKSEQVVLETHLLNFSGDLYGKRLEVAFLARLRDEVTFDSPSLLAQQIRADIQEAQCYFKE